MADKSDRKPEAGGAGAGSRPGAAAAPTVEQKSGLLSKTPVLLTGVMIIEAIVLVAGFKILGGGPRRATAAELVAEAEKAGEKGAADRKKTVEVQVVEFKAPNKANGRTFLYDVSIYVITKAEFEQRVKDTFKDKGALIQDRIRTIIAESDPEKLGGGSEPGLETLRRQVKYQLDEIVGDGVIDEVLVPRCIPFRTDY